MLSGLLQNNSDELGLVTETLIYEHMLRLFFKIRPNTPIQFTRDNKEVDIILKLNGKSIPIEVKKSDEPSLADMGGLIKFCDNKIPGIVSCGRKLSLEKNIIFIPHWLFILLC